MRRRRFGGRRNANFSEGRMSSRRRRMMREAWRSHLLTYDELDDAQKQRALEIASNDVGILQCYTDWESDCYYAQLDCLIEDYKEKTGIGVNKNAIRWNCSSQGPYPDHWDDDETFETVCPYERFGREFEFEIHPVGNAFYSDDANVWVEITNPYMLADEDWYPETYWFNGRHEDADEEEKEAFLRCAGKYANEVERYIEMVRDETEKFLDKVYDLIRDTCLGYPDEEWLEDFCSANEIKFLVDDDGDVVDID